MEVLSPRRGELKLSPPNVFLMTCALSYFLHYVRGNEPTCQKRWAGSSLITNSFLPTQVLTAYLYLMQGRKAFARHPLVVLEGVAARRGTLVHKCVFCSQNMRAADKYTARGI